MPKKKLDRITKLFIPIQTNKRPAKNEMKEDQQIKIKTNHCANFSRFVSLELGSSFILCVSLYLHEDEVLGVYYFILYYKNNMRWHTTITESRRQHG